MALVWGCGNEEDTENLVFKNDRNSFPILINNKPPKYSLEEIQIGLRKMWWQPICGTFLFDSTYQSNSRIYEKEQQAFYGDVSSRVRKSFRHECSDVTFIRVFNTLNAKPEYTMNDFVPEKILDSINTHYVNWRDFVFKTTLGKKNFPASQIKISVCKDADRKNYFYFETDSTYLPVLEQIVLNDDSVQGHFDWFIKSK